MTADVTRNTRFDLSDMPLFGPGELVDIDTLMAFETGPWLNRLLLEVNDTTVRLALVKGEFSWHVHAAYDEYFQVLAGTFFVDIEDRTHTLKPGQGIMVAKGTRHRTRATARAAVLVVGHRDANLLGGNR